MNGITGSAMGALSIADRNTFQREVHALRARGEALTREDEAIAAARRRIPTMDKGFLGVSALLFLIGSTVTTLWCASMSAMGAMPMPGGWEMSMTWMRMPGQTWLGVATSSLAMWLVMMVAMMMPCLTPMLLRYRRMVAAGSAHLAGLTALVGAGYFFVWTVFGMAVLGLGFGLAAIEMQQSALAQAVPIATGIVVLVAGVLQLSAWKARQLARCREVPASRRMLVGDSGAAWGHGVHLGLHCGGCCVNLMAILLVVGIMDLRAMALVTGAVTLERVLPRGGRIARAVGVAAIGFGSLLIARAAGVG